MSNSSSQRRTRPLAALMFKLPLMIDCATFESFIDEYFDGTLPSRRRFVFNLHMLFCRECRVYLNEYKETMAMARSQKDVGFSEMGMGPVPDDLIKAVVSAQNAGRKR